MVEQRRFTAILGLIALIGLGSYLGWAGANGHVGFPLDDAWIHQTYARNLVKYRQWAFVPGHPSAGSTAPLWTLLLALGYALGVPFRLWTYACGGACLIGTVLLAAQVMRELFPEQRWAPLVGGLGCALEWHLIWAAASGMETLLFALLALAMWDRLMRGPEKQQPLVTGLLGGALILTRPEGILVVALVGAGMTLPRVTTGRRWTQALRTGALLALGSALVVAPYLALNFHLSGTLWPNTFYAKQAEYAVHRLQPLWIRLWGQNGKPGVMTAPFVGGQALLVPGILWSVYAAIQHIRHGRLRQGVNHLLPLAWVAATVGTYALRLPVTYQHGRYLIPVVPILVIYGAGGTLGLIRRGRTSLTGRVLTRTLLAAAAILSLAFWALGARAYSTDVAIIEEEMVATARWLDANVEPDTLIAAHDIGAIGYFAGRPLLDLAGLVSPEVIPFIRDQEKLLDWLEQQGADYLVTFPSWYPRITADPRLEEVFRTNAAVTVAQGGENMVVYTLHWNSR